jgi:hypothetical protein
MIDLSRLTGDGWKEGNIPLHKETIVRILWNEFPSRFVCSHNDHTKIMVVVEEYHFRESKSLIVELCGGVEELNGHNISIRAYNLRSADEVLQVVPRLIAAWEAANDPTLISG